MRAFLEQYAVAMFTIVVVMVMTLMSSGLGNYIESLLVKEITKLTEKGGLQTDNILSGTGDEEDKPGHVLITGQEFNNLIPTNTTSIEFLNTAAPTDVETIDVSADEDRSILAWSEGTTFYVAPKETDHVIYANPDSSYMFKSGSYVGSDGVDAYMFIENIKFNNFNTSKVTNMYQMFYAFGLVKNGQKCNISGLENWNTSNVTTMEFMFTGAFENNKEINLNLSKWDTSKVTDMSLMFYQLGFSCDTSFTMNLSNWDVSNVTNMYSMFGEMAYYASTFELIGLKNWDVSNVTNMRSMFRSTGKTAIYTLDLTSWQDKVGNLTENSYSYFDDSVDNKIISPWE